jgi:hypothetical protein
MGAALAYSRSKMHLHEISWCILTKIKLILCVNLLLWIHHLTPKSKQQSKQWTVAGCSASKKTRSVLSAGKAMALVFWDAERILFCDYLEKGKTITGEYYSNLLTGLEKKKLVRKDMVCKTNKLSGQCNPHKIVLAMGKQRDLH